MSESNRREFLKKIGAGAGSALAAAGLTPRRIAGAAPGFERVMYRKLGSTGELVSEIGFGTMNTREADLIHAAIDNGINYIDTANVYMNGVNEQIVGSVMKTKRDKVFLVTKVGLNKDIPAIPDEIAASLKRLQTDHVDLLLLHKTNDRKEILNDTIIKIFDDARRKGQTRFVGFSTHNFEETVFDAAIDSTFWEAVLTGYNYFIPPSVAKGIRKVREAGIAVIGMKNLITMTSPSSTRVQLDDIREDKNSSTTPQQALLKWVLEDPYVDTIIPGMTAFEHLSDNLAVMGKQLTFEDTRILKKYAAAKSDSYCRCVVGCTGCRGKCPKGVEVSEFNRCLGYAYGYGSMELARENYAALPLSNRIEVCGDCDECTVKCVNGLNIGERITAVKRLFG